MNYLWALFAALVSIMVAIDLFAGAKEPSARSSLAWSVVWLSVAAGFGMVVYAVLGAGAALDFATGYLVEKALAVDNVFVFVVIFAALRLTPGQQRIALVWGVFGAILLRGLFIFLGAVAIERFKFLLLFFGALLVITGLKLALTNDEHHQEPKLLRWLRRRIPISSETKANAFFERSGAGWVATPLFLAVVAVELSDVLFAVDSIPAIFAITRDPFIVLTSNIFAILGLRALYFLLAGAVGSFPYLKYGLSGVLVFVGVKMLASEFVHPPTWLSLVVITCLIGGSIVASKFVAAPHSKA